MKLIGHKALSKTTLCIIYGLHYSWFISHEQFTKTKPRRLRSGKKPLMPVWKIALLLRQKVSLENGAVETAITSANLRSFLRGWGLFHSFVLHALLWTNESSADWDKHLQPLDPVTTGLLDVTEVVRAAVNGCNSSWNKIITFYLTPINLEGTVTCSLCIQGVVY